MHERAARHATNVRGSVGRRRSDVAAISIAISVEERRLSIRSLAVSTIRK